MTGDFKITSHPALGDVVIFYMVKCELLRDDVGIFLIVKDKDKRYIGHKYSYGHLYSIDDIVIELSQDKNGNYAVVTDGVDDI